METKASQANQAKANVAQSISSAQTVLEDRVASVEANEE